MLRRIFSFFLLALALNAFGQVTTDPSLTGLPGITAGAASTTITSGTITITATPSVGYKGTASFTRPANTTTYTASDVIGGSPTAVITIPTIGASGGHIMLTSCDMRIDVAAVPSGMGNMRLYLYSATPPSALADNAAWDLPSGDRTAYIGYVDLGTPADLGSTLFTQVDQINKQVQLATGATSLYAYLTSVGSFAPAANSEVYSVTCRAVGL